MSGHASQCAAVDAHRRRRIGKLAVGAGMEAVNKDMIDDGFIKPCRRAFVADPVGAGARAAEEGQIEFGSHFTQVMIAGAGMAEHAAIAFSRADHFAVPERSSPLLSQASIR